MSGHEDGRVVVDTQDGLPLEGVENERVLLQDEKEEIRGREKQE